jgi:hypothetical protein
MAPDSMAVFKSIETLGQALVTLLSITVPAPDLMPALLYWTHKLQQRQLPVAECSANSPTKLPQENAK